MNRTIKQATVRLYHYDSHLQLQSHLKDFIAAYNFAKRLRALNGLTPFEYIYKCWSTNPNLFTINPLQLSSGPYI